MCPSWVRCAPRELKWLAVLWQDIALQATQYWTRPEQEDSKAFHFLQPLQNPKMAFLKVFQPVCTSESKVYHNLWPNLPPKCWWILRYRLLRCQNLPPRFPLPKLNKSWWAQDEVVDLIQPRKGTLIRSARAKLSKKREIVLLQNCL